MHNELHSGNQRIVRALPLSPHLSPSLSPSLSLLLSTPLSLCLSPSPPHSLSLSLSTPLSVATLLRSAIHGCGYNSCGMRDFPWLFLFHFGSLGPSRGSSRRPGPPGSFPGGLPPPRTPPVVSRSSGRPARSRCFLPKRVATLKLLQPAIRQDRRTEARRKFNGGFGP